MIIHAAIVKLLADKLSNLSLCDSEGAEEEKKILLEFILLLLEEQYCRGLREASSEWKDQ